MKRRDRDQPYGPAGRAEPDQGAVVRPAGTQTELAADERPRLTIGLVPETCWLSTVRDAMRPSAWDGLRRRVDEDAGHRCEVCGGGRTGHCHELWDYDDVQHVQHVQRLVRMVALCSACHQVRHIDQAAQAGRARKALEHLARVNGWSALEAER